MKKLLGLVAIVLVVTSLYGFDVSSNQSDEEAMFSIQGIGRDKNDIGSLD